MPVLEKNRSRWRKKPVDSTHDTIYPDIIKRAIKAYAVGDYTRALQLFREAKKIHGLDTQCYRLINIARQKTLSVRRDSFALLKNNPEQ